MPSNGPPSKNGSAGSFPIEIVARATGLDQVTAQFTRFNEVLKLTGATITQQMNNIRNLGTSLNTFTQSTTRVNQSLDQYMNTTRNAVTNTTNLGNTVKTASTSFQQIGVALGVASGEMVTFSTNAQRASNTMRNAITNTRMYDAALMETNAAMNTSAAATDSHSNSTKRNTQEIINNVRHVTALGLSFMMLTNQYSDAELVQGNIRMQEEKLAEAHQKTIATLEQYGKTSHQYQQALAAEEKAKRGLAFEQREATAQLHNQMFMYALIATEILSSAVPAMLHWNDTVTKLRAGLTGLQGALSSMPTKLSNVANFFGGLGNALAAIPSRLKGTSVAAVETGGALANLESRTSRVGKSLDALGNIAMISQGRFAGLSSILLRVAPPLIAVTVALALVATNFMGVRDKLEAFGVQVGNTVPVLAPLLEELQGIAAKLGLTGESADQAKKHLDNASRGFANMSTLWNDTVANMQSSNNRLIKSMGDTAAVLSRDFVKAGSDLSNQLKATTDTWNKFVAALGRGDYKTATDLIIKSFESIPSIIGTAFSNLGTIISNAFIGLGNTLGPAIMGIGTELGNRLIQGLLQAWSNIVAIVNSAVILPMQNAFNAIADAIKPVAEFVWNKLGLVNLVQMAINLSAAIGSTFMNIVNFAKDIQTSVWNKLGLAGLVTSAYNLGQAVWGNIVKGINDAGASIGKLVNPQSGNAKSTVDPKTGQYSSTSSELQQGKSLYDMKMDKVNAALAEQTRQSTGQSTRTTKGIMFGPPKPVTNMVGKPQSSTIVTPQVGQTSGLASTGSHSSNFVGGAAPTVTPSGKSSQQLMSPTTINVTTSAIEKQRAEINKLNESLANNAKGQAAATKAGFDWLAEQNQIIPVTKTYNEDLKDLANSVGPIVEQNTKMEDSLRSNAAAMKLGFLQTVLFNQGVLEQKQALQQDQMEVIKTSGTLQEYGNQIQQGSIQQIAFNQGVQEVHKFFLDTIKYTANQIGQLAGYTMALTSATAQQIMFNNGLVTGATETTKMIVEMDQARGVFVGTRTVLVDVAQSMGLVGNSTRISNESLTQFIGVMKGAPDAVKRLVDSLSSFAGDAINKVAEALNKGKGEVSKAFKEIEKEIHGKLTNPEKKIITVEAKTENAVNEITNNISLALNAAANGSQQAFNSAMKRAMDDAKKQFQSSGGEIKNIWGNIMKDMATMSKDGLGSPKLIQDAALLVTHLESVGVSGDKAKLVLQGLGLTSKQADTAIAGAATSIAGTGTAAQTADPQLQKYFQTLTQFGNIETAAQTIFEQVIPALIANVAVAMNNSFKQGVDDADGYLNQLVSQATTNLDAVMKKLTDTAVSMNTNFQRGVNDADGYLNQLESQANKVMDAIIKKAGDVAVALNTQFQRGAQDAAGSLNQLQSQADKDFAAMIKKAGDVAKSIDAIGKSADTTKGKVSSLKSELNSLPNINRTITYTIKTVGSKPKGGQFGLTATVDKPTHFLAGEGNSPERVKISPGTMPFVEDFRAEMNQFFRGKRSNQGNGSNNQNSNVVSQGDIVGKGNNYNYQSDSGGSNDSHSTELHRDNYAMHKTRVLHETPIEVHIDIGTSTLAKKLIRLMTEEMNSAATYG